MTVTGARLELIGRRRRGRRPGGVRPVPPAPCLI